MVDTSSANRSWIIMIMGPVIAAAIYAYAALGSAVAPITYSSSSLGQVISTSVAQNKLIGRGAASGTGVMQEITLGTNLALSGTTLNATDTDTGITQLTGDVTAGPGSGSQAATIPNDTVTYAKMQNVSAASKLLGRGDSGSGDTQEITLGSGLSMSGTTLSASGGGMTRIAPSGRLTLTSATPVTTSNVTGATTIYYALYTGDQIPIYDGSSWTATTFTELSQATTDNTKSPAAVTTNSNYDLFVWSDGGTMRCTRGPAWSSDTSRGTGAGTTELERVNGILMNKVAITNGPGAQRGTYVGTVRSDGSSQINDSDSKRCVWNMYNRVVRNLNCVDSTASWTYTTDSFREANASGVVGTSRVEIVRGQNEEIVLAQNYNVTYNGTSTSTVCGGVGISSTTANSAQHFGSFISNDGDAQHVATYTGNPGLGYYYIARLERSVAVGTTTWNGTSATARMTLGMMVETRQ